MFHDLKVLELASVLAGPSVGQFFAELGADVIKVENLRTGGDVTRTWKSASEETDDRSAYFCSVNWGKRSVAVDLTTEHGQAIVHKLASRSDIVIASFKPGDARKLKVDYSTLSKLSSGLIYGEITGYGRDSERTGYDAVIQAEAGFMYMNGEPGRASLKMPVALVDVLAGHHLKEALLVALLRRHRTGVGSFVGISLFQAAVSSLVNQATNWLMAGYLPGKEGSAHPNIAPYGDTFRTAEDSEIILAIGTDRQFSDLCGMLGIQEVALKAEYINNSARVQNRNTLNGILQRRIRNYSASDLMARLHESKIPAGEIRNLKDVFDHAKGREMVLSAQHVAGLRSYLGPDAVRDLLPPPHFGEHTLSVIQDL